MEKGAIISECGKYRYQLWRIWDELKPLVLFMMHNPSTADADKDDPTIRRLIGFSKEWGYGGFYVGNIFPYRETNPEKMKGISERVLLPIENFTHLAEMSKKCKLHIVAHGIPFDGSKPKIMHPPWHHLGLTKLGYPKHPLYLPKTTIPQIFK